MKALRFITLGLLCAAAGCYQMSYGPAGPGQGIPGSLEDRWPLPRYDPDRTPGTPVTEADFIAARPRSDFIDPSPEDIEEAALAAREHLRGAVEDARDRRNSLNRWASVGGWVARIGQYVGGGGAIVFGLDDKGTNAAWSGAVAAAFTLLDDGWNTGDQRARAERCDALSEFAIEVEKETRLWELNRNSADYRATFADDDGPYALFMDRIQEAHARCGL